MVSLFVVCGSVVTGCGITQRYLAHLLKLASQVVSVGGCPRPFQVAHTFMLGAFSLSHILNKTPLTGWSFPRSVYSGSYTQKCECFCTCQFWDPFTRPCSCRPWRGAVRAAFCWHEARAAAGAAALPIAHVCEPAGSPAKHNSALEKESRLTPWPGTYWQWKEALAEKSMQLLKNHMQDVVWGFFFCSLHPAQYVK